jgi:Fur family zinc uptake transcriptional regulator
MIRAKHAHIEHGGAALTDAARESVLAAGEQWTEMRAAVFEELRQFDRPASAYDIAERLSATLGRRVVPNSIYRILDLFVTSNLALRVESRNGYVVNNHPDCVHDCIFLICDGCGLTTHVDDDAISRKVRSLSERDGFVPQRPVIEVHGQCKECTGRDESKLVS